MTRLLLLALVSLALAGCKHPCSNQSSQACPSSGCAPKPVPVSYGTPVMTYPASYTMVGTPVVARPVGSFPVIPPPNATELPFPAETIPPTILPTGPVMALPNGTRSVGLPK